MTNLPSQKFIAIQDVKDNVVILKSGALRAILLCASINFALRSEEEQQAIIYKFQQFLNSLDFPVQIVVQSRKLNLEKYLTALEERRTLMTNELLRIQTEEYVEFIKSLAEISSIMSKYFYLVIPFVPGEARHVDFFTKLEAAFSTKSKPQLSPELFNAYKEQLFQRAAYVSSGLSGVGVKTILLETNELIELFHNLYNPTDKKEKIIEPQKLNLYGVNPQG